MTTPEPFSSMQLSMHVAGIASHQLMAGAIKKPWGMSGFSGFKVGEVEFAVRGDEYMVRLMSATARNSWRRVYELGFSCTRLDLQVTVDMKSECQPIVWSYYDRANRKSAQKKRGPKNRVILGNDGGATLYCGERASNRFGRCYAKGPQSKLEVYKTALRFELQLNGKLARVVAARLAAARSPETFAVERTVAFFNSRIGRLPVCTSTVVNDSCARTRSDVYRKLKWLGVAVNPSVRLLSDSGYRLEVLRALGLDSGEIGPTREHVDFGPSIINSEEKERCS